MTVIAQDPDELVSRFVRPDAHVHLAMTMGRPNALTFALARAFAGQKSLTVSTAATHSAAHALALSGAVDKMITCFLGDTYPTPRPNVIYRELAEDKPYRAELWSLLSFSQRLMAGAMALPYTVTRSLYGSDLWYGKEGALVAVPDPDGGPQPVVLAKAMRPDITMVHGAVADRRGNIVLVPPLGEGVWSAYAAKEGVIATVERIVDDLVIDESPERVVIPGQRVIALCEAPHGAHPQSLRTAGIAGVEGYRDDYEFLTEIAERCRTLEGAHEWYQEWAVEAGSHAGYVAKLGSQRLAGLALPPAGTVPTGKPVKQVPLGEEITPQQRTIVLGARAIEQRVLAHGYDTLLAGIGTSHLAAWLAAERLRAAGVEVKVCAELGFYGQQPEPGDVFLFSQQHANRSEQLSDVVQTLGGMVAANESRCLGVLAAGEIDPLGNINTSKLGNGRWITGSGGANDIASTVDCLVVATAAPRRYVDAVAYVTSPGGRVREVVSQFGRFQRRSGDEKFRLATWLATAGRSPDQDLAELTNWPAPEGEPVAEPAISPAELAALHRLDPEGFYR